MPYKERLYPWVLARLLPKMQRLTVGQFRTRSDADNHLEILRGLVPGGKFAVIFNPDLLESQQADTCYRTSDRVIFKEPLPGHGEGVRLFFLGIKNFDCKSDRTLTPEKRSPRIQNSLNQGFRIFVQLKKTKSPKSGDFSYLSRALNLFSLRHQTLI